MHTFTKDPQFTRNSSIKGSHHKHINNTFISFTINIPHNIENNSQFHFYGFSEKSAKSRPKIIFFVVIKKYFSRPSIWYMEFIHTIKDEEDMNLSKKTQHAQNSQRRPVKQDASLGAPNISLGRMFFICASWDVAQRNHRPALQTTSPGAIVKNISKTCIKQSRRPAVQTYRPALLAKLSQTAMTVLYFPPNSSSNLKTSILA